MRKALLFSFALLGFISSSIAQPVINAATSNPVAGDVFIGHWCDTAGVTAGASGAGVTWNLSAMTEYGMDTTSYLPCTTTGAVCDSFAGSNLIQFDNYNFYYCQADATRFSLLGVDVGAFLIHFGGTPDLMRYPLAYNDSYKDTFEIDLTSFGYYQRQADSNIYDAYGTLVLPSGTFSNVVRVHTISVVTDSSLAGSTWDVQTYQVESYNWYMSGFHHPLLAISYDTSGSTTSYVSGAEYYAFHLPLSTKSVKENNLSLQVYPNPATNVINIKCNIADSKTAQVTITDVMGRTITAFDNKQLINGINELSYSTANMANGLYIVHVKSGTSSTSQKVMVNN